MRRTTNAYDPLPFSASVQLSKLRHHPKLRDFKHHNINDAHDESLTFGQRIADKCANAIGSWSFIIIQSILMCLWITINTIAYFIHYDSYPYVLLNLFLSCEAALSAPVIMMSQNRQAEKDRLKADQDYLVNMKAEHEVMLLLEKINAQEQRELELLQKIDLLLTRTGRPKE